MPSRFNDSKYDWEKLILRLLGHPNSSQMSYDLQQETLEAFSTKLPKITGMDIIDHLVDVTSSHPMNHLDKFLALVTFIILFVVITLLALKCMPIYLHKMLDN